MQAPREQPVRRNLAFLWGAESVAKLLGFVVFGRLGHLLGRSGYGDLEFAIGIWFILNLVMEAGLTDYGAKEAAQSPERVGAIRAEILVLRLSALLVDALFLGAFAWLAPADLPVGLVVAFLLPLLPAPWLSNWLFQARGESIVVAAASLARQVILAAAVFAFVDGPEGVHVVPIGDAVALTVIALVQALLLHRRAGAIEFAGVFDRVRENWRRSVPMTLSAIIWALRMFAPLLIVRILVGGGAAGIFGAGHRLIMAAHTFVWLWFFNLLPSWSRLAARADARGLEDAISRSATGVANLLIPIAVMLAPIALEIPVRLFGSEFQAAGECTMMQSWMLVVAFLSGHHRYGLIALGRPGRELASSAAGAAFAVVVTSMSLTWAEDPSKAPFLAAVSFVGAEIVTALTAAFLLSSQGVRPRLGWWPMGAASVGLALSLPGALGGPAASQPLSRRVLVHFVLGSILLLFLARRSPRSSSSAGGPVER